LGLPELRLTDIGRKIPIATDRESSIVNALANICPQLALLYILYTADVSWLVEELKLGVHLYADDVQLYVSGKSSIAFGLVNQTLQAIGAIQMWMSSNRLCLNSDKTQFIWLGTFQQLAKRDMQHLATT